MSARRALNRAARMIMLGALGLRPVGAQAQSGFTLTPWKDCSHEACNAGEAFNYVTWSRQSDNNRCKAIVTAAARDRGACDALVPVSGEPPIDEIGVVNGLRQFLSSQVNTFPLPWGSASAGFSFIVDPMTGGPVLAAKSFGPFFAERPLTGGKGIWNLNVTAQRTRWESVDDTPLDNTIFEAFRDSASPSCRPGACLSLRWTSSVELTTSYVVIGAAYGVSDRVDIGMTVPLGSATVRGRATRAGSFDSDTSAGVVQAAITGNGHSSGLGDMSIRTKVSLRELANVRRPFQAAVSGELRLPTGDADAMLGTGHAALKTLLVGSYVRDALGQTLLSRTTLHFNTGVSFAGSGVSIQNVRSSNEGTSAAVGAAADQMTATFDVQPSNEFDTTVGLDAALNNRLTISGDYLLRTLFNSARLENIVFRNSSNGLNSQPFLTPVGHRTTQLVTMGAKAMIHDGWVGTFYVLLAVNHTGARPRPTPVIGLERNLSFR